MISISEPVVKNCGILPPAPSGISVSVCWSRGAIHDLKSEETVLELTGNHVLFAVPVLSELKAKGANHEPILNIENEKINVAHSNLDFETPMTGFCFSQDVVHHGFELCSPSTVTPLKLNSESPSKETNTCFRLINNALKDYDLQNKVWGDKSAALEAGTGYDFIDNPSLGKDVSVVCVAGLSSSEAEALTESCESEGTVLCPLERVNED